jgi:hypothetical protein
MGEGDGVDEGDSDPVSAAEDEKFSEDSGSVIYPPSVLETISQPAPVAKPADVRALLARVQKAYATEIASFGRGMQDLS